MGINQVQMHEDVGLNFATGLEGFVPTMGDLLTRITKYGDSLNQARQ